MRRLGFQHTHPGIAGHQHCGICHNDNKRGKARERKMTKREVEDQMNDIERKKLEEIKKLAHDGKICFGAEDRIAQYGKQVQCVLDAIATVVDEPGIRRAWVSDGSMPSDFCLEDDDYARVSALLGVPVNEGDYLWQVAERLATKGEA